MSCPDCTAASQAGAAWGGFTANCRGCCARSIARSPQFHAARKVGGTAGPEVRAYRELLRQIGGLVKPPVEHSEVRDASAIDERARATPAAQEVA
jgi:hypothetical protein